MAIHFIRSWNKTVIRLTKLYRCKLWWIRSNNGQLIRSNCREDFDSRRNTIVDTIVDRETLIKLNVIRLILGICQITFTIARRAWSYIAKVCIAYINTRSLGERWISWIRRNRKEHFWLRLYKLIQLSDFKEDI